MNSLSYVESVTYQPYKLVKFVSPFELQFLTCDGDWYRSYFMKLWGIMRWCTSRVLMCLTQSRQWALSCAKETDINYLALKYAKLSTLAHLSFYSHCHEHFQRSLLLSHTLPQQSEPSVVCFQPTIEFAHLWPGCWTCELNTPFEECFYPWLLEHTISWFPQALWLFPSFFFWPREWDQWGLGFVSATLLCECR